MFSNDRIFNSKRNSKKSSLYSQKRFSECTSINKDSDDESEDINFFDFSLSYIKLKKIDYFMRLVVSSVGPFSVTSILEANIIVSQQHTVLS